MDSQRRILDAMLARDPRFGRPQPMGGLYDPDVAALAAYAKPQAEAKPYQPSVRDRLGAAIAGDSRPGDVRYNLAQGLVGSAGVGGSGMGLADFTPAGIPMAASDAAKSARMGDYFGAGLSAAGVVAPGLKSGRAAMAGAANAAEETAKGIRAYHGSPHDFDRFSLDKIGTGEGAQAYGHGLYFADSEDVASTYKHAVSGRHAKHVFDGKPLETSRDWYAAIDDLNASGDWRVAKALESYAKKIEPDPALRLKELKDWYRNDPDMLAAVDRLAGSVATETPKGRMYEVNIRANPDDFLDWDKPLSEQSEKVREFAKAKGAAGVAWEASTNEADVLYRRGPRGIEGQVRKAPRGFGPDWLAEYDTLDGRGSRRFATADEAKAWIDTDAPIEAGRGAEVYQSLRKNLPDQALTAELKQAGIPGIKYLDAGSRGSGDGSRNYVVFDDSLIEILRKYGLLGPLGLGAAASVSGQNDGS